MVWGFPISLLAFALLAGGCASNPVSGEQDFVLLSKSQEIALGRKEHPKILEQFGVYEDRALTDYVSRVGRRVAQRGHRSDLDYHFTVLDSKDVNAFALPGGYIYITRGLMAYLNSEAELAAVLGHEIGHVTARHGVRQYSAATATNLGVTIGSILVPELRGQGAQDMVNVLGTALLRGYGREHELEADRLGAEYLARSGYSPEAMLDVIEVLKDQEQFESQRAREEGREPRTYHGVFATHPRNDERLQTVVRAANRLEGPERHASGSEDYLKHLEGLTFGPSASEGVVRGSRFFHGPLGIAVDLPEGWSVENRPDRLIALGPERAALLQLTVEPTGGLGAATFLQQRVGGKPLERRRSITAGELTGHAAVATIEGPFGPRPARLAVVYKDELAFLFVGSADGEYPFRKIDEMVLRTARSLHRLSEAERELAAPLKLRIIRADAGTNYPALAGDVRLPDHAEERLRLLNGHYRDGKPSVGQSLKTVE